MAFETLSYARRLKQAGVPDATRELVATDFASKGDIAALKTDIARLETKIAAVQSDIAALEQRTTSAMENLGLRLTVRLGGLIAVGIAILAAIIKL
jgi:hypothetical protein